MMTQLMAPTCGIGRPFRTPGNFVDQMLDAGPIMYYRMGEVSALGSRAINHSPETTDGSLLNSGAYTLRQTGFVPGGYSIDFNATTDAVNASAALNTNIDGNYTTELESIFWMRADITQLDASPSLVVKRVYFADSTSGFPIAVTWHNNNSVRVQLSNGGDFNADLTFDSSTLSTGTDYLIRVVYRAASYVEIWANGVLIGRTTHSVTINSRTGVPWRFGSSFDNAAGGFGESGFDGQLGEASIFSKRIGASRYAAMYRARTEIRGATVDPYFNKVALLLNFAGADGSTTFTDSSSVARTVTPIGNAQIDTAQFLFGSSSALFDGSGDGLSVADASDLNPAGDFAIEFAFRCNSLSAAQTLVTKRASIANRGLALTLSTGGALTFSAGDSDTASFNVSLTTSNFVTTATWYFVRICRCGDQFFLMVNGRLTARGTWTGVIDWGTGPLYIGIDADGASNSYNGWLSAFRYTSGFGRGTKVYATPVDNWPTS